MEQNTSDSLALGPLDQVPAETNGSDTLICANKVNIRVLLLLTAWP